MRTKIFSNSLWVFSAQAMGKVAAFCYTIFLAQALGVEQFGLYIAALAYFSLFSAVTDFGFNRFLIREGAVSSQKLSEYLQTVLVTRITLTCFFFGLFSVLIYMLDSDMQRVNLVSLALLAVVPQAIALTLDAALVAEQKFRYSSIGFVTLTLANLVIGYSLIQLGAGPTGAVIAVGLSQLSYAAVLFIFLLKSGFGWQNKLYWQHLRAIVKGSLPYGVLGVLGLIYFRVDALLLTYLKGSYEAGIYGAAFKFFEAVVFIPSVLFTILFPAFAKLHDGDPSSVKALYYQSMKCMLMISVLILAGFMFILPPVIQWLLPQYQESIPALRILSLGIPFVFLNAPAIIVLFSSDKYLKPAVLLAICTMSFNVIVNLISIPIWGYYAASVTTVLSEMLSLVVFYLLLSKKVFKS